MDHVEDPAVQAVVAAAGGLSDIQLLRAIRLLQLLPRERPTLVAEGAFLCPSRHHAPAGMVRPDHDTWRVMPNGDRCCSYCGSASPETFLRVLRAAGDPASPARIEGARNKAHKVYLHRPDVANAAEGAIKFYTWHAPPLDSELAAEIRLAWADAALISGQKLDRRFTS